MTFTIGMKRLAAAALAIAALPLLAHAAGEAPQIERQKWSFAGLFGRFDQNQLQRGFQVYKETCAQCHGISRVDFRNLAQPGGPSFNEDAVKGLAATYEVLDGPNDDGKMFKRPGRLADKIPPPYANEKEARAVHNGAYPPDLSLIAKARGVEYHGSVFAHPFHLLKDMIAGYQEGGADYVHALLTGYVEKPADFALADGMNYNRAFAGHQISMPPPLQEGAIKTDGKPTFQDGTPATIEQMSRDVVAFLSWAGDPKHDERKRMGLLVMIYLLITAVLLYLAKKRIWKSAH
jgi:ubiquinol-cytochrome c reductase cytochrome c1 subunit